MAKPHFNSRKVPKKLFFKPKIYLPPRSPMIFFEPKIHLPFGIEPSDRAVAQQARIYGSFWH